MNWLYKKVIQLQPKHPLAYTQLGVCMLNKREYKAAEALAKTAIKLAPQNYHAYILLGRTYEVQKREKESLEQYKKAIAIAPKEPECKKLLNNMMKKRAQELGLPNLPGLN